jgi:hypothetical protein
MEIEKQVCSFNIAKKLKDLNIKQESLWYWCYEKWTDLEGDHKILILKTPYQTSCATTEIEFICSAFSVAELGKLLPDGFYTTRFNDRYHSSVLINGNPIVMDNEADCRAKMIIWKMTYGKR